MSNSLYSMGNGVSLPNVYDPQVMTEDNSLETQLNKYPEISKKVIDLAPQFGVNYLLEKFGKREDIFLDQLILQIYLR